MPEKSQELFDRELEQARGKLHAVKERLRHVPGVVDILVGLKVTGGQATEQVAYQVYVDRKVPTGDLPLAHRIPSVIEGWPTDVIQKPIGVPEDEILMGGGPLNSAFLGGLGAANATLGAVARAAAGNTFVTPGTPLLLTNQHVAEKAGDLVATGCMCNCCCCECGSVGRVIDARRTARLDSAIATIFEGVHFAEVIIGIGAVRGMARAQIGMPIVKFGQTTALTNGRIVQDNLPSFQREDNITMTGQIMVSPVAPTTDMSNPGDSGSVYVHADTRQIVGLHHAGGGNDAFGCHLTTAANDGVADAMRIEFARIGTAGAIPLGAIPRGKPAPAVLEAVATLRRDLERSDSGQRWLELIKSHSAEVRYLVNHHRPTQVAWQRSQGPAFVGHFLKSAREPEHRVPREIGGMHMENVIIAMASVLQQHGSDRLAQAITQHYLTALECAQGADSAEKALANARRLAMAYHHVTPRNDGVCYAK